MKITETLPLDPYEDNWDLTIETKDGTHYLSFGRGEPEDMSVARDLSDCLKIAKLLEIAYNAGKNGETFDKQVFVGEEDE